MTQPHRIAEWFCGLGGFHMALDKTQRLTGTTLDITGFDINENTNDIYEHNFGRRPVQKSIESLATSALEGYDTWLMSPPCQPYTRQGNQRGSDDTRASAFIKLMLRLGSLQHKPSRILIENVVGFEKSDTHEILSDILSGAGYSWQEFVVSPTDLGLPYNRPRYFLLAKLAPLPFARSLSGLWRGRPADAPSASHSDPLPSASARPPLQRRALSDFLVSDPSTSDSPLPDASAAQAAGGRPGRGRDRDKGRGPDGGDVAAASGRSPEPGSASLAGPGPADLDPFLPYYVPLGAANRKRLEHGAPDLDGREGAGDLGPTAVLEAAAEGQGTAACAGQGLARLGAGTENLDIVVPEATCDREPADTFTKNYGRFVKGTGSVLPTSPDYRETLSSGTIGLSESQVLSLRLRFFTPREIASLHGFPPSFRFPPEITLKQRYAALGNSLSADVVAELLEYLYDDG